MKRKILLSGMAVALLGVAQVRGQSIWPSTLNASGGSAIIGGIEYDYSIGEIALVSTFTTPSIIVTQGLLQSDLGDPVNSVPEVKVVSQLQVFPNPTTSIVNIQFNALMEGSLSLRLMDITGKQVLLQKAEVKQGANLQKLDMGGLASSIYMLEVMVTTADGKTQTTPYKIQKF